MKMKGIILNSKQVNTILETGVLEYRKVLKVQPRLGLSLEPLSVNCFIPGIGKCSNSHLIKVPFKAGDKLFVKETFSYHRIPEGEPYYYPANMLRECVDRDYGLHYWADGSPEYGDWFEPSISPHMRQHQSRLTVEITDIKVEKSDAWEWVVSLKLIK